MSELKIVNPTSLRIPTKSYSQGIVIPLGAADLMFITGQVAQNIEGEVIAPNDAEAQTRVIYNRLSDILAGADMTLDNVVKAQIFLTDIADGPIVSKVRDEIFKVAKPVSTLVEVNNLVKPGCCVEIELTAVRFNS